MQHIFEKIKEKIFIQKENHEKYELYEKPEEVFDDIMKIVDLVEKQHNNGWIPVEERYPDTDNYILLSLSNFSIPIVGRYEEDEDGGAFYAGDEDETLVSHDLFVNAWMPLVKPYRPEEE